MNNGRLPAPGDLFSGSTGRSAVSAESLPRWFDARRIENALNREKAPDRAERCDILNKSLALEPLTIEETAALMRVEDEAGITAILTSADVVKQRVYGDRIVLSAPLHVTNHCESECLYCANRRSNGRVERKYMTPPEMREAALKLIRQGHKRVFLVSGQLPGDDVDYLAEAAAILYTVHDGGGEIRCVNVSAGPLEAPQYAALLDAFVGTMLIYQDTYHEPDYRAAHVAGPKRDFSARLNAPGAAFMAGAPDVGGGLMLGLGPWRYDLLGLVQHETHLAGEYGMNFRTVSLHRMRPAPGSLMEVPHPVNDADYLRCIAITRLAVPHAGIVLTTREPSGIWRRGCGVGASQLLTGSVANPYDDWTRATGSKIPFPLGEDCRVDEVVSFLLEEARHLPSFCAACPRLGRRGADFLSLVREYGIGNLCGPNSAASFLEFLLRYATPRNRPLGESLLAEKLDNMSDHERGAAERLLAKVRSNCLDEFI
ncbi:MAG: radical SAM protein [Desulfovibrio sp.]|jgi:2-iminoacetate synthase|nr:radical SAM protein [Desulfovibrio sp.]